MAGTNILNIEEMAPNQNQKETTSNDGVNALEQACNQPVTHNMSAGNVVVTQEQFTRNVFHLAELHGATARTLTVPHQITPTDGSPVDAVRLFVVRNTGTGTITVDRDSGGLSVDILGGTAAIVYHNGTDIILIASSSGGSSSALDWKESVRVATVAAGTLASDFENGDTVDGVVLATDDRILIQDQASGSENGLYTVNASGAPTRATDADGDEKVTSGLATFVSEGTANAGKIFILTTVDPIIVDTTALVFAELSGGGGLSNVVEDTTPELGGPLNTLGQAVNLSKGADVASASALTLGTDGDYFDVTGTTTITSIVTVRVGAVKRLQFDAALTLTHHATDLILPGGINIITAAGDEAEFVEYAIGDWKLLRYLRSTGFSYDVGGFFGGTPGTTTVIFRFLVDRTFTIPSGMTDSQGHATTGPSAQTDFDVHKNGVSVGTMRFASAATTATFIMATATAFAIGDRLDLVTPANLNTISDVSWTVAGRL